MESKSPISANDVLSELVFTASRSGGPGGQNVNKVNTKVTLKWDIANSEILKDKQRERILKKLENKITKEGVLVLSSQAERSQLKNKEAILEKLNDLLVKAFTKKKKRKPTKPTKASVKRRLEAKKKHSDKKKMRRGWD